MICLHQFLGTKTTETNKSLKTDANLTFNKITNEHKERALETLTKKIIKSCVNSQSLSFL